MYNHSVSSPLVTPMQPQLATARQNLECDRNTNTRIRELLRFYGLRTSLIRFKVINALVVAMREGRSIGVHWVHSYLESCSAELPFTSVREVLKRLCDVDVILLQTDRSYRFTPEAWVMLKQHLDC